MHRQLWQRLLALAIASMLLVIFGSSVVTSVVAAPPTLDSLISSTQALQISVDAVWVIITGFLVFFILSII